MEFDLRQKLMREVLDCDKTINKSASQSQSKRVPKDDMALLQSQLNSEELQ